jgi:DNA-binding transcriptional LysR family regulator
MLADRLDCALVRDEPGLPERPHGWPLYGERLVPASPTDHRLAA